MELPQGVYKEVDRGTYTASIYVCGTNKTNGVVFEENE